MRNLTSQRSVGKDYFARLSELTTLLNQARLELREAENSRDALKREIAGEEPVLLPDDAPAAAASVSVPEIDGRIEAMKRNLDALLQRYTEQHPDVVGTKRQIQDLEEQKAADPRRAREGRAGPQPESSVHSNPVYQQLKVSLAEAEATVASLRTRVAEYEARYARLKESAKIDAADRGRVRAAQSRLRHQQEELREPGRAPRIGRDLRRDGGCVRRRFSADRSAAGFAAAGRAESPAAAARRRSSSRWRPASSRASWQARSGRRSSTSGSLRETTGLPVLGAVSMIVGEAQKRRERRGLIGFLSGVRRAAGILWCGAARALPAVDARRLSE